MELKYHIITFGCQMNHSDSERMSTTLVKLGMQTTTEEKDADVVVINACSVRQKAIDRIWGKLNEFDTIKKSRPNKPLYTVLTGCVLPADRPKFASRFDLYFPMKDLTKLPEMVDTMLHKEAKSNINKIKLPTKKVKKISKEELIADKQISYLNIITKNKTNEAINNITKKQYSNESPNMNTKVEVKKQSSQEYRSVPLNTISQVPGSEKHYLQIKPAYTTKFSAFVPVMTGCNAFCTYCAVPFTRGREVSRKPEEIITEVEQLIQDEYKEVTLLGQIVNKYMTRVDDSLIKCIDQTLSKHDSSIEQIPELHDADLRTHKLFKFHHLLAIINEMQGDFWLRFTSSHPKWFTSTLINTIARCEKIPPHIHLPVQAGANTTLRRMLRPYTIEEYKDIITKIREAIPRIAITTDCIVGFCGETEEEYKQTNNLFKWAQYDMAYIAQYSPRPGTKAQTDLSDDVPHHIKKQREVHLNTILAQSVHKHNQKYVGKTVRVLIDSQHANDTHTFFGRTDTNKKVNVNFNNSTITPDIVGSFLTVTITGVKNWGLQGIPII